MVIGLREFMSEYDYLIVCSGLFGSAFAHFAHMAGKRCMVIDRRCHLGEISTARTSRE